MRLTFLGVRGSTPATGASFVRYGGNTSCVAVSSGGGVPRLVLDAGTGLRLLSAALEGSAFRGSILLSHLHWDHMQGLPFFAAGDRPDSRITLYAPAQGGRSARDLLAQSMSPPAFPIDPEGLLGDWTFTALEPGPLEVEDFTVTAAEITHKGGRTYGYRVDDGSVSMAYLPDHAPAAGLTEGARTIGRGVDVVVHDAQFVAAERRVADLFGHATVDDAIAYAMQVGAKRLVLFHHGPGRTDDQLDALAAGLAPPLPVTVAREGDVLDLRG